MDKKNTDSIRLELQQLKGTLEHINKRILLLENQINSQESSLIEDYKAEELEQRIEKAPSLNTNVDKKFSQNHPSSVQKETKKSEGRDMEFRIGGTWLNRIGVVAVILGLAYFLKYSFDNDWIGPVGRVLLGIVTGITMLFFGERLKDKYLGYAQGLLGGGSLALFFSVYTSYQFYDLISSIVAFSFLVLVMILTVFLAIRHHSLPIGILGILGGYSIPFIIGSEDPSLWTLTLYLTLITSGVLGVSIYKKWRSFQYISFIINQFIFAFLWLSTNLFGSDNDSLGPLSYLAITNFVLYLGIATIYNIRTKKISKAWEIGMITSNALFFFIWSLVLIEPTFIDDYKGVYALFLSVVYLYLGRFANKLFPEDKGQMYSLFAISFVLLTIAIPLQLSDSYVGFAWFAEALGFIFIGKKILENKLVYTGFTVLLLGLFVMISEIEMIVYLDKFLINLPTALMLTSLITIWLIVVMIKDMEEIKLKKLHLNKILYGILLFIIFIFLAIQNEHYFTKIFSAKYLLSPKHLTLTGLWLIYAITLFFLGIRRRNKYLRYVSLGLLTIILLKMFLIDLANLATIYKIILFIIVGLSFLGISFIYQKKKDTIYGEDQTDEKE